MFRDALMHRLVSHLNIDTQAYRPSAVFINGEFWGIYNIRERYDKKYFSNHYNIKKRNVAMLEFLSNKDGYKIDISEGIKQNHDEFLKILNFIKYNDISKNENMRYLKTVIDIENFINYNVANMFYVNIDWPANNTIVWKFTGSNNEFSKESNYNNNKWQWVLKDIDFGFNGVNLGTTYDMVEYMLNPLSMEKKIYQIIQENATLFFRKLIENTEFKIKFINYVADQLNTSFLFSVVKNKIHEYKSNIKLSISEHINRWNEIKSWEENVKILERFAYDRPDNMRKHIIKHFKKDEITGTTDILVKTNSHMGYIVINSISITKPTPGVIDPSRWAGKYFKEVSVTISAIQYKGYYFDHWEGNIDKKMIYNDKLEIVLVSELNLNAIFKNY